MNLALQDITYIKGVGTKRADTLRKELGVSTALDLLHHYPYKYIDRSRFYKISDIDSEEAYVQIKGEIIEFHTIGAGKTARLSAMFSDGQGVVELVWFRNIQYLKLETHVPYLLFGKPSVFDHRYNFPHPELTPLAKLNPLSVQGLMPVYNTTDKMKSVRLDSKALYSIISSLHDPLKQGVPDTLGMDIVQRYHLLSLTDALLKIHFPKTTEDIQRARERLKFEELFYIQLSLLRQMKRREHNCGITMPKVGHFFNTFYRQFLPFTLTGAQKRVVKEIQADLKSGRQMNRLLQGDVGSGKTLVAMLCALLAADNGCQTCIMAPTEILANQHMQTVSSMLAGTGVNVALLTGSTTKKQREILHARLSSGDIHILIGTHALIEDNVQFANLGLCIIDEQHRFGVAQRAKLWAKNITPPHILVMTATPIPRTLAMTVYGDLSVSIIDELPPGRKPIHTVHYSLQRRQTVYQFIDQQISAGRQIYVVYPLIKENEKLDLKDLQTGFNELCEAFPRYRISMVHGQMKAADKDYQMQRFVSGETQILVATTVIEVGVNVPNASVMIIMNAERFGLSQLHQLRGRVGRGAEQSYCILLTRNDLTKDTRKRMDIMVATNDGFRIAEADLQLRGPGDLDGTQQSGLPFDLKIASLATDGIILETARKAATEVLQDDPLLESEWNKIYRQRLDMLRMTVANWSEIS